MIVFKISLEEGKGPYLFDTLQGAQDVLAQMVENAYESDGEEKYVFEAVEMDEEEFNNLPEFQGF